MTNYESRSNKPNQPLHHVRYEITHCMLIPKWRDEAPLLKEAVFLSFFVHARNQLFHEVLPAALALQDIARSLLHSSP